MRVGFCLLLLLCPLPGWAADCNAPAATSVDWQRCYADERDLSGHILTGARLRETSFQRAILNGVKLDKVDAYRARFVSAVMAGAHMDGGQFMEVDFTKADLSGASLRDTDLRRAKFFRASLRGADLTGAKTGGTDFFNADLSGARWTDGIKVCAEGSLGQCN